MSDPSLVDTFMLRTIRTNRHTALQAVRTKLRGRRVLLERRPPPRQSRSRAKEKPLPKRRKEVQGVAMAEASYERLETQHGLWCAYAQSCLGAAEGSELVQALERLDRHGAWLRVARSQCPSHVSARGFVLLETQRTVVLLSEGGCVRIPKRQTTFEMRLPDGCSAPHVMLDGDHMVERAG